MRPRDALEDLARQELKRNPIAIVRRPIHRRRTVHLLRGLGWRWMKARRAVRVLRKTLRAARANREAGDAMDVAVAAALAA